MRKIRVLLLRLGGLFHKKSRDRELEEEIESNLQFNIDDNLRAGMSPEEARRKALLKFGGIESAKEAYRDRRSFPLLEDLIQDVRVALRMLAKRPGIATIVILTLALGIGANTAMFSIIDAVILRPLPYKDADRLVVIWESLIGQEQRSKVFAAYGDLKEWRDSSKSFEQLEGCTWAIQAHRTLHWQGRPYRILSIPVTAGLFSLLGAKAAVGRTFETSDLRNGCTVILSNGFWKNRLGGATDVAGATLMLDNQACTVIGIMPDTFDFYPKPAELWTLISPNSEFERNPWETSIGVFGRLKPDVDIASARAELNLLHQQAVRTLPPDSFWSRNVPVVYQLQEEFTWMAGRNLRTGLFVLFGAVVCVLLIACVNVASLELARAAQRERELAIRAALGSGRYRLVRQLLTETMLLALLGAILGAALAGAGVRLFRSASPVELPPGNAVTVNWQVMSFTIALAILAGLLSGLLPAIRASRIDLNEMLKRETRSGASSSSRATKLFIVAEVAITLTLLAGAGLLIQSFSRLSSENLGYRTDHLLTADVSLPALSYPDSLRRAAFYDNLLARLSRLPGAETAAVSSSWSSEPLIVAGRPAPPRNVAGIIRAEPVSDGYLATMGIPLLRGRGFESRDREGSPLVAIINEEAARKYFTDENPVGRQIKLDESDKSPWLTIIGVAGNIKVTTLFNEMYESLPQVYLPLNQSAGSNAKILVRTSGFVNFAPTLEKEVAALDRDLPVYGVKTMERQVYESLAHPRFRAILLGGFAALALLLAAIGIYGMLSETVSRRSREIGIRMALGAESRDVLRMVLKQGLLLALAGAGIGVAAAFSVTRLLASMLYGVRA
ncbi:MAG: ABC transporter permease, partial [Blastocatellia bacterium]|nr:ABC transporter permease [Blastocatellia bacterium]